MKKIILRLLLISILILTSIVSINSSAETVSEETTSLNIETFYPNNILDYQNLQDISYVATHSDYLAYTISNNYLYILNKNTRQSITLTDFSNIYDIKFINSNNLLLTNYNTETSLGSLHIITINNNTTQINTLSNINISNLRTLDVYSNDSTILIGLIKNNTFELYELTLDNLSAPKLKEEPIQDTIFTSPSIQMIITDREQIIVAKLSNDSTRIYSRQYHTNTFVQNKIQINNNSELNSIKLIDFLKKNNEDYLIVSTNETMYLYSIDNFNTQISTLNNLNITDIDIHNELIYICDNDKKLIKSYSIKDDNLQFEDKNVLICSNNNSLGRFYNLSNIYIQGNKLFVSDTNNDRIQIFDNNKPQAITCTDGSRPKSVTVDNNQNIYFITNNNCIQRYSANTSNDYIKTLNLSHNAALFSDISFNNINKAYILDYQNNKLLSLSKEDEFEPVYSFVDITFSQNSQIEYIKALDLFAILNDNKIHLLDLSLIAQENSPIVNSIDIANCSSITCDLNSIYALCNNSINHITINSNIMHINENPLIQDNFQNYSTISYDIVYNQMFAFDTISQSIVYFNYSNNNSMEYNPVNNIDMLDFANSPLALSILNNNLIYDYPYSLGDSYKNIESCIGIELKDNYYRVLFNYNNELKVGFIHFNNVSITPHDTIQKLKVITINFKVPVYKYPTILKYNKDAIITSYIPIDTKITISKSNFPISIDDKQFYMYENNGKIGYIFMADIILDDSTNIVKLHIDNATAKSIGENEINLYSEDNKTIITTINNGQRIFVESYNKHSEYTKVIYKDENLNSIVGYIKTELIEMDKLDNSKIVLICIIIISILLLITILITYFVIKKKRQNNLL